MQVYDANFREYVFSNVSFLGLTNAVGGTIRFATSRSIVSRTTGAEREDRTSRAHLC